MCYGKSCRQLTTPGEKCQGQKEWERGSGKRGRAPFGPKRRQVPEAVKHSAPKRESSGWWQAGGVKGTLEKKFCLFWNLYLFWNLFYFKYIMKLYDINILFHIHWHWRPSLFNILLNIFWIFFKYSGTFIFILKIGPFSAQCRWRSANYGKLSRRLIDSQNSNSSNSNRAAEAGWWKNYYHSPRVWTYCGGKAFWFCVNRKCSRCWRVHAFANYNYLPGPQQAY